MEDDKFLKVKGKKIDLPIFLPDATKGYVRGVESKDLIESVIKGVVVNIYHLLNEKFILDVVRKGGIHSYMNFDGLVISDSGGFQVMSLIRKDKTFGEINDECAIFTLDGRKAVLTPEKCVELQLKIKSDIVMCLDDCTEPNFSLEEQEKSVERTIKWAKRCKEEFDKRTKNLGDLEKPLIFGIIQGGKNLELRKKCADALIEIGFDGYAFGGWPVEEGKFLTELLGDVAKMMPNDKPKYAMGVGKPEDIVACVEMGYDLFDCVIPTREARSNRLYSFKKGFLGFGLKKLDKEGNFYEYVRVRNKDFEFDKNSISKICDCYACKNYSRSKIRELFKERDVLAVKLATIHNLRFYSVLMERLKN